MSDVCLWGLKNTAKNRVEMNIRWLSSRSEAIRHFIEKALREESEKEKGA